MEVVVVSHLVKCFPNSSVAGLCVFVAFLSPPPPLNSDNEYIVTGSTALQTEQKKDSLRDLQSGGKGKKNLKGVAKRKQQRIICKVPKTTRGKETTTSSLQITAQAIYLVTLCLFQALEGLSCFYGFSKCVYLFILHFVPII